MDDYYYEQRRRTEALEHSNYALERQNELTELQNRINAEGLKLQAQQLALTATAAQAQIKQNERLIDLSVQQVAATYDAANASREIAATIERGQRAWAEVELAKMKRRQKKDADKEFTHEQEQKIHQLWRRKSELSKPPSTPGARFMLWEEMRAARADIAIDCVHDIDFLDRDHEVGVKLRDFIIALVNRYPELIFVADDYNGKIALAKRLQDKTSFRTFAENGDANMLMMLRKKFPELNIPNCDTYPQKSFNFIQDVARLKNLCALLGDAVAKDKEIQGIIITAFHLDSAVFGEEKWATVIAGELSPFEANYYYRFYRNHKTYDSATPADALQRILEPLAKCLKIDVDSVARLRRVEQAKHKEIANVDGEIESIIAAKRRAEEEKERERRRQEEEIRRRKEEERRRVEEERNRQRLQAMKENLIDALFRLLKNRHGGIEPCVWSKNEIKLDNTLLGYTSDDVYIFGNRVQFCNTDDDNVVHVHIIAWKAWADENDDDIGNVLIDAFMAEFRKAKDILPSVDGIDHHIDIELDLPKPMAFQGCAGCSFIIFMVLGSIVASISDSGGVGTVVGILGAIAFVYYQMLGKQSIWAKKVQAIFRSSRTVDSLLHKLQSNNLSKRIIRE